MPEPWERMDLEQMDSARSDAGGRAGKQLLATTKLNASPCCRGGLPKRPLTGVWVGVRVCSQPACAFPPEECTRAHWPQGECLAPPSEQGEVLCAMVPSTGSNTVCKAGQRGHYGQEAAGGCGPVPELARTLGKGHAQQLSVSGGIIVLPINDTLGLGEV